MQGVLRIVVCALVPWGCAACGPRLFMSRAAISEMLYAYEANHCSPQTIYESADLGGAAQLKRADELIETLRSSGDPVTSQDEHVDVSESYGQLSYSERGDVYGLNWNALHPPGIPVRDDLAVRGCVFAPAKVRIFDVSAEAGGLRVLFVERKKYSWFGRALKDNGLLSGNNSIPKIDGFEQIALLEKDDKRGTWQILNVSLAP